MNELPQREPTALQSKVSFHYGKAFLKLANTYATIFEAVLESAQNSIDSGATRIRIVVDRRARCIDIEDNGSGASREKFDSALLHVCDSEKERDKLGQFGLGLIAHAGKCAWFSFTSSDALKGPYGYKEWTFKTASIEKQREGIHVPVEDKPFYFRTNDGRTPPKGVRPVDWRTRVHVHDYVEDRKISHIRSADALKQAIIEKYGIAMRRNDVTVTVRLIDENGKEETAVGKAKRYAGKRLPEVVIEDEDAGKSIFRLYLAPKKQFGYQGKVMVGVADNDFRFSVTSFLKDADILPAGIRDLFKSGVFEGEILTTNGKLHDSRKKLVQNDAFVGFCAAIEQWFNEHGKQHAEEARDERQGQRLQDLSVRSLQNVQSLLSDTAFERLRRDTIDSFDYGTSGAKRSDSSENVLAATFAAAKRDRGESEGEERTESAEKRERTKQPSYTASGPLGKQHQLDKGAPRGLRFAHYNLGPNGPLSILEPTNGTIFFNLEHPEWVAAATAGDRELMQLQEMGAVLALVRYTMPKDYESMVDLLYSEVISPLSFLLRKSPSFNLSARLKANKQAE
jgi:hypothetical protein